MFALAPIGKTSKHGPARTGREPLSARADRYAADFVFVALVLHGERRRERAQILGLRKLGDQRLRVNVELLEEAHCSFNRHRMVSQVCLFVVIEVDRQLT